MAAIGRVDISPRTAVIALGAGALLLVGVLATGARAERIGAVGLARDRQCDGRNGSDAEAGAHHRRLAEAEPAIQRRWVSIPASRSPAWIWTPFATRVQGVGWVKEARVVRLLPDTLIVEVKEHDRLAVWQEAGQIKVIDARGQVIDGADARRYPTLPLVVGKGADVAAGEILPLLAQRPRLMGMVDALVRVDERRWDLRLKDGSLIQLPATEQEAALIRLDALDQRERLLDLGFARVDLRTPDEVAVRPAGDA
jgi:cell division protein FtsQ